MQIQIPKDVTDIISQLNNAGYEAYIVGGCVRDYLLGKQPSDWDVTTSAKPEEVKGLFHRTIDTGIRHGTVTVMKGKCGYEVTTYRIDGEYEDARHPKEVTFTSSLEEDLKRRDFTMNAMAYHPESGLVDLFGGCRDMQGGIIRCVGNAKERFTEDALRMMRAVRFSAQLDYGIEPETLAAIRELAPNLEHISVERIQAEMCKLLVSEHPEKFRLFYETGLTKYFLPEFDKAVETEQNNPHHRYTVGDHLIHSLSYIRADKVLRVSMLLHDIAKPLCKTTDEDGIDHFHGHAEKGAKLAEEILRRLRFDNDTIRMVTGFTRYHDRKIERNGRAMRRAINQIGAGFFPGLFEVKQADAMAQSTYLREEKLQELAQLRGIYQEVLENQECFSLKDLAVNGRDLMAAGVAPGKEIGVILNKMLSDVLDEPSHNRKEYLMEHYLP